MSETSSTNKLYVYMNNIYVGLLKRKTSRNLEFVYDTQWLQRTTASPISLSLPLAEKVYKGDVVSYFFDNLLPDNDRILERIQKNYGAKTKRSYDLLYHIGRDCVGALQFLTEPITKATQTFTGEVVDAKSVARILHDYRNEPLGMSSDSEFRISLAGAQEKTALLWHQNKWWRPTGVTPTTHIIKQPIGVIAEYNMDLSDSVENEWLCTKILDAFGLPVPTVEMKKFNSVKTLIIERFDRQWTKDGAWLLRIPQEDMCQALSYSPGLKYESHGGPGIIEIMKKLEGSDNAKNDRIQFMKTTFLFWVLAAPDGHAKNFSLFIMAGGRYRLTPIYDVISAYPQMNNRQWDERKVKLAMAVHGKNKHYHWHEIQIRHWFETAEKCNFPKDTMLEIVDDVFENIENVIDKVSKQLPKKFPQYISKPIFDGMKKTRDKYRKKTHHILKK